MSRGQVAEVDHLDDVRTVEPRHGARLAGQALCTFTSVALVQSEYFDRDSLVQGQVGRLVDEANAALTEFVFDAVLVVDHAPQERIGQRHGSRRHARGYEPAPNSDRLRSTRLEKIEEFFGPSPKSQTHVQH